MEQASMKQYWEQHWRDEIQRQFEIYGTMPLCRRCSFSCKQYSAPNATIQYCPKLAEN